VEAFRVVMAVLELHIPMETNTEVVEAEIARQELVLLL
jgi:hypothetical protein